MNRRQLILGAGATVIGAGVLPAVPFAARTPFKAAREKELSLLNLHTGERFNDIFYAQGEFDPGALKVLNTVLRDHRSGEVHEMDTDLFHWLYDLQARLGTNEFHIISGYRSPRTNAKLRNRSNGVAKRSLHMQGRAIDVRLPGVNTAHLRKLALKDRRGGVGYYKRSDFIHLDTGRPRFW